jgi:hypothetical protein
MGWAKHAPFNQLSVQNLASVSDLGANFLFAVSGTAVPANNTRAFN